MTLWKSPETLAQLRERSKDTLMERLGIDYLEIGDDYRARNKRKSHPPGNRRVGYRHNNADPCWQYDPDLGDQNLQRSG
jgi:hypothetical protein